MLAVTHLRLVDGDASHDSAGTVLAALAERDGFVRGSLARAMDDPHEWVLVTEWVDVRAYRRGLSSYDVKLAFAPVMSYVRDEVSAYEVVAAR